MRRGLLAAGLSGLLAVGVAQAQGSAVKARTQCFRSQSYQGFRPLNDRSFIVRANVSDFYRIDLAQACPALTYPSATLIMTVRGGDDLICKPLDWDLKVGQVGAPGDVPEPCIVSGQTALTPEQVAALPKGQKP